MRQNLKELVSKKIIKCNDNLIDYNCDANLIHRKSFGANTIFNFNSEI